MLSERGMVRGYAKLFSKKRDLFNNWASFFADDNKGMYRSWKLGPGKLLRRNKIPFNSRAFLSYNFFVNQWSYEFWTDMWCCEEPLCLSPLPSLNALVVSKRHGFRVMGLNSWRAAYSSLLFINLNKCNMDIIEHFLKRL